MTGSSTELLALVSIDFPVELEKLGPTKLGDETDLLPGFGTEQQDFLDETIKISPMRVDHGIQVSLFLIQEIHQRLPGAIYDLEMTICLKLMDEVDHLCDDYSDTVPFIVQF
jgi:hypothetical protein